MQYILADIDGVGAAWMVEHPLKALAIQNGEPRSPALEALAGLKEKKPEEFKKIIHSMRMVGHHRRVANRNHVKPDDTGSGVYELRANKGHARLFFFYYSAGNREIAVFLNFYWKAKGSRGEQDRHFEKARTLRKIFLEWMATHYE